MIRAIDQKIQEIANLRNALVASAIFVVVSVLLFNFGLVLKLQQLGNDATLLDSTFNYSPQDVDVIFTDYGPEGRRLYRQYLSLFDPIYAIIFAIAHSVLIAYLYGKLAWQRGILRYVHLAPFAAAGMDFLENIGIITLLFIYPAASTPLVNVVNIITMLKLVVVNILTLFVLVGIVVTVGKTIYWWLTR